MNVLNLCLGCVWGFLCHLSFLIDFNRFFLASKAMGFFQNNNLSVWFLIHFIIDDKMLTGTWRKGLNCKWWVRIFIFTWCSNKLLMLGIILLFFKLLKKNLHFLLLIFTFFYNWAPKGLARTVFLQITVGCVASSLHFKVWWLASRKLGKYLKGPSPKTTDNLKVTKWLHTSVCSCNKRIVQQQLLISVKSKICRAGSLGLNLPVVCFSLRVWEIKFRYSFSLSVYPVL